MSKARFDLDQLFVSTAVKVTADALAHAHVDLEVIDQIDHRYVVRPVCRLTNGEKVLAVKAVKPDEGLAVQITQGEAQVEADPYTGLLLIRAKGARTVKARATLEAQLQSKAVTLTSPERELGIDPTMVPADQMNISASGGGVCTASWDLGEEYKFNVRVRASIHGNVIPRSESEREIHWRHGEYFAHDAHLGLMRIRYNPDYQSKTVMRAQTLAGEVAAKGFFPADGKTDLYFTMEFVDLGLTLFNKEPMSLPFNNSPWPPYSTALNIAKPVEFFNMEDPEQRVLVIHGNEMQIYDYSSIQVECLKYDITAEGELQSRWLIRNEATRPVRARWFALGDFVGNGATTDQGNRLLGAAGSGMDTVEVEFNTRLAKSSLSQLVTMNVVSLDDPVVMGMAKLQVRYPAAPADQAKM